MKLFFSHLSSFSFLFTVRMLVLQDMCGDQRTTCGSQLSLSTMWVPRIELGSSGLPSESSQWPFVLVYLHSKLHTALADISRRLPIRASTAWTGTPSRNLRGLQGEAGDRKASWLSARTDIHHG